MYITSSVWKKKIIESRYGNCRNMKSSMTDRKNSYWWKDLRLICEVQSEHNWFDKRIRWKYGNGSRIRFWEDWWVGDEKLMTKFSRLYSVSVYNKRVVSDFGMWNRDGTLETFTWQILWRRKLFDWEKDLEK